LERAEQLAKEKGVTAAQIALAFVMNQPMNMYAVVGPHGIQKFKENIAAAELKLTPQELEWLDLKREIYQ
jgi:aryl-alcohol dehydrogenase-like predicted oxidoreductase